MRMNDVVTGASQKAVEPVGTVQLVGREYIHLPAQLLRHLGQPRNDGRTTKLGIANDVKQLHNQIYIYGCGEPGVNEFHPPRIRSARGSFNRWKINAGPRRT